LKFIDETFIFVASGKGGNGQMSFRREKFVPRGGPDGGDGGNGGALILEATAQRNTLIDYRRQRFHRAQPGEPGGNAQMHGARGKDLVLAVPVGTLIYDEHSDELLADLTEPGDRWSLAGGRGGSGNMRFKTATNRSPRIFEPGGVAIEMNLRLELKLLADVGLLGFPNAGKSTLLGRVSAARPKVADYPFTTLVPQLGVVRLSDGQAFVIADIPGLIEGAADGAGLGHRFLKHVERCACFMHLVAPDDEEGTAVERFHALNQEVKNYDVSVRSRPQFVVLTKIDTLDEEERARQISTLAAASGARVLGISSVTGEGIPRIVQVVFEHLVATRKAEAAVAEAALAVEAAEAAESAEAAALEAAEAVAVEAAVEAAEAAAVEAAEAAGAAED
jgi:GTP-binding protein